MLWALPQHENNIASLPSLRQHSHSNTTELTQLHQRKATIVLLYHNSRVTAMLRHICTIITQLHQCNTTTSLLRPQGTTIYSYRTIELPQHTHRTIVITHYHISTTASITAPQRTTVPQQQQEHCSLQDQGRTWAVGDLPEGSARIL